MHPTVRFAATRRLVPALVTSALLCVSLLGAGAASAQVPSPDPASSRGLDGSTSLAADAPPPLARPKARGARVPTVAVSHTATLSTLQAKIDWCRGAVFIQIQGLPGLIAEHNYCGGTARLGSHRVGGLVRVVGPGVTDGLYKVVAKKTASKRSTFNVLRGMGGLVLQTCQGNSLLFTGLVRVR